MTSSITGRACRPSCSEFSMVFLRNSCECGLRSLRKTLHAGHSPCSPRSHRQIIDLISTTNQLLKKNGNKTEILLIFDERFPSLVFNCRQIYNEKHELWPLCFKIIYWVANSWPIHESMSHYCDILNCLTLFRSLCTLFKTSHLNYWKSPAAKSPKSSRKKMF